MKIKIEKFVLEDKEIEGNYFVTETSYKTKKYLRFNETTVDILTLYDVPLFSTYNQEYFKLPSFPITPITEEEWNEQVKKALETLRLKYIR